MKNRTTLSAVKIRAFKAAVKHSCFRSLPLAGVVAWLAATTAQADNLLVNPGFEQNSGHVLPIGWSYFSPPTNSSYFGDYWVESAVAAHSGTLYWKEWGALYLTAPTNNVAGIYQEFSAAPGSVYQASGWFYTKTSDLLGPDCYTWIEVSFSDSNGKLLALYKSDNFSSQGGANADNWLQYQVTNACDLSQPVATGDPYFTTYAVTGAVSQLVAPLGTQKVRYRYAYLQSGGEGGSAYFDDAVLDQVSGAIPPTISDVFPLNMIFVNPNDGVSFTVNSPSGFTISSNNIGLTLNGIDVSGNLVVSGTASNKTVAYHGLQSNMTYTASITVTDSFNSTFSLSTYFETTWVGTPPVLYLWEAEDFDFTNGMYINNPDLCNASGDPNCYFGKVGNEGVDEHSTGTTGSHLYRPDDAIRTAIAGDYLRKDLVAAGRLDYAINPLNSGEWINYTRDWSNGTYWVLGRLATDIGLSGSLTLGLVNTDATTTDLGTFSITSGHGWTAFENVYLKDTNGNLVTITLNGKTTLRVTSGGNLLPNFFTLVAGQVDLPQMVNLYPTGTQPFEYTNALSFTVIAPTASFPAGGIKLFLHGADVSSGLTITGSGATNNVVYTNLQPNAVHTALITVTNSLGHGISVTNHFDTFTQTNFMFEAEDFDYDGGQFVPAADWVPDAYSSFLSVTNIDFQHTTIDGEQFQYRNNGIPQSTAQDFLRDVFVNVGGIDYHLDWFGIGDWANYTRVYPTGSFNVYARSAGLGTNTMYLDQVVSGAGTSNQVTARLGQFTSVGSGNQTHDWVPLTDTNGAPAIVNLAGTNTVRITTPTGLCYPNYFMLVTASTAPVGSFRVSAGLSGGNIILSFPTQTGASYRVLYRNDLGASGWTTLTTVAGDGNVKSVSDPATGGQRYYRVVSP